MVKYKTMTRSRPINESICTILSMVETVTDLSNTNDEKSADQDKMVEWICQSFKDIGLLEHERVINMYQLLDDLDDKDMFGRTIDDMDQYFPIGGICLKGEVEHLLPDNIPKKYLGHIWYVTDQMQESMCGLTGYTPKTYKAVLSFVAFIVGHERRHTSQKLETIDTRACNPMSHVSYNYQEHEQDANKEALRFMEEVLRERGIDASICKPLHIF